MSIIPWAGLHSFVIVASKPARGFSLQGRNMPKRFTVTEKWNDPWFRTRSPDAKLLWGYLCDVCDIAGIWEIDLGRAAFDTGLSESRVQGAFKEVARGYERNGRYIWIRNFLKHQGNLPLNSKNMAHIGIRRRLVEYKDLSPLILAILNGKQIPVNFDGEPMEL